MWALKLQRGGFLLYGLHIYLKLFYNFFFEVIFAYHTFFFTFSDFGLPVFAISVLIPPHLHYSFRMTKSQSLFFVLPQFFLPYAIRNLSRYFSNITQFTRATFSNLYTALTSFNSNTNFISQIL